MTYRVRSILTAVLSALFLAAAAGCGSVCMAGERTPEPEPLKILFATDLHYISPSLTDNGAFFTALTEKGDGKVMLYSEELLACFTDTVLAEAPDVLVLGGDLTFNGARASHEDLAARLVPIREAGITVLVIPGNHDLNSTNAARFEGDTFERVPSVSAEDFFSIYRDFGYDGADSNDPASGSYIRSVSDDLRILMLDVNSYGDTVVPGGAFAWISEQLQKAEEDGAKVIAVAHQNLLIHNLLFADGYQIRNASALELFYKQYGVLCSLSGHMHLQHSILEEVPVPEIVTSALSVWPNHYAVLTWDGETLEYETRKLDVSGWAQRHGSEDPNLLGFEKYARDFFDLTTVRSAEAQLAGTSFSQEEKEAMVRALCAVNEAVFSGEAPDLSEYEDALVLWDTMSGTLIPTYLFSVREDLPKDFNHARFAAGSEFAE